MNEEELWYLTEDEIQTLDDILVLSSAYSQYYLTTYAQDLLSALAVMQMVLALAKAGSPAHIEHILKYDFLCIKMQKKLMSLRQPTHQIGALVTVPSSMNPNEREPGVVTSLPYMDRELREICVKVLTEGVEQRLPVSMLKSGEKRKRKPKVNHPQDQQPVAEP